MVEERWSLPSASGWMSKRKINSENLKCLGNTLCFLLENYSPMPKFSFLWRLIVLGSKDFYLWAILKWMAFVLFFDQNSWWCQFVFDLTFCVDTLPLADHKYFVLQSLFFLPADNFSGVNYQVDFCEYCFSKELK